MERQTDNDTVPDAAPLAHCLRAFVGREGASTSGRAHAWLGAMQNRATAAPTGLPCERSCPWPMLKCPSSARIVASPFLAVLLFPPSSFPSSQPPLADVLSLSLSLRSVSVTQRYHCPRRWRSLARNGTENCIQSLLPSLSLSLSLSIRPSRFLLYFLSSPRDPRLVSSGEMR